MIKIIGDIMLDRWILGTADRMSPEAPVPVLKESYQTYSIGGAGNLALNLANLNVDIELHGAVGTDKEGYKIIDLLKNYKTVNSNIMFNHSVTTTKTRLVGQGGQHICRWDREDQYTHDLDNLNVNNEDIIVVSDYAKGVIKSSLMNDFAGNKVFVDPKQSPELYKNCFLVKPNMKEYTEWFGEFDYDTAREKLKQYGWTWLVVTDGAQGVHVVNETEHWHAKEDVREVADVTGAGDTFLAVLVYAYATKNMTIPDACQLACYASARNVEKRGVQPVTFDDLNRGVVWTNGVFDILHPGHLELLKYAKSLGERLVVGINDDASVKRLKGPNRPVNDFITRKKQLETLPWVDEVVIFSEDTPQKTIENLRPDVIVKGGDYTRETTVGHELAEVKIFPTIQGHSTTELIGKIKK